MVWNNTDHIFKVAGNALQHPIVDAHTWLQEEKPDDHVQQRAVRLISNLVQSKMSKVKGFVWQLG